MPMLPPLGCVILILLLVDHFRDDFFASVDKGIYCKQMGGGSVGATGEFNFSVSEAYLIENGKVTKALKRSNFHRNC
jgi:predicted Zn-dependent protease